MSSLASLPIVIKSKQKVKKEEKLQIALQIRSLARSMPRLERLVRTLHHLRKRCLGPVSIQVIHTLQSQSHALKANIDLLQTRLLLQSGFIATLTSSTEGTRMKPRWLQCHPLDWTHRGITSEAGQGV